MKISDLNVNKKIIDNLLNLGYENLTEIQEQAIDKILANKNVFGLAQTGSGKTAAFLVPIIHHIASNRNMKALILAPTRDLAEQIFDNNIKYAKFLGIKTAKLIGGVSYDLQKKFLADNPHIIIGTPGRIVDLIKMGEIKTNNINFLVLDEADQMLDLGFINDMKFIISKLTNLVQTSLFSATASDNIMKLVNDIMPHYELVKVKSKININEIVEQKFYLVSVHNKLQLLLDILGDSKRTLEQCIIFTRTKNEASEIAKYLRTKKLNVEALHSDRSTQSRSRILKMFRNQELQIIVATNVAARGIDINNLPLVINFDIPEQKETYVHRIGRTGRAGKTGEAITFCTPRQKQEIKEIEKIMHTKIPIIEIKKYLEKNPNAPQLKTKSNHQLPRPKNKSMKNNQKTKYKSYRSKNH